MLITFLKLFYKKIKFMKFTRTLIILFFLFISLNSTSQVFQKHKMKEVANFGFYAAANTMTIHNGYKDFWMQIEPYFGFIKWNINIAAIGEYTFFRNNVDKQNNYDLYGFGTFLRYYYPFRINTCKKDTRYFVFLSEFSARITNYAYLNRNFNFDSANKLKYYHLVLVPIGMQFNIWKGLYGDIATEWNFYSKGYNIFIYRLGFEYKFSFQKKNEKINNNINPSF